MIQRLAKEAGIEGRIGLHKFRKTFATMVAKEEGIEAARILLGHEDIVTTQRYLAADEIAPEQDRKTVNKRFASFGELGGSHRSLIYIIVQPLQTKTESFTHTGERHLLCLDERVHRPTANTQILGGFLDGEMKTGVLQHDDNGGGFAHHEPALATNSSYGEGSSKIRCIANTNS